MEIQITLDCREPHELVEFWAQTLNYQVEDHTAIVEGLLASGRLPAAEAVNTRRGKGFTRLAACRDPEGRKARMLFQQVPEDKTVKNRQHLDLQFGAATAAAEVERILGLGATLAWTSDEGGQHNTTLRDPEGNEFCVS